MIKMYMQVSYMIALMSIVLIIERAELSVRKLTYKETKIIFILEFIVDINLISFGTITEPSLELFTYIVLSVCYGIMCYSTYKELKELKKDMKKRNEEENENLTNIKEKDTKWKIGKIEAGFEKRWT